MLVYLYPHSSHKVWASVSSPGEQDKLIPKALSGDRWSQDRVVEGKGPKRNESMEEPEEKAGSGARRELFQFCLNSLLFRSWSISRRTCCREPPWRWWTAAPRSPSMSPPRASTGWRACWDTRLVWASHPCWGTGEYLHAFLPMAQWWARHWTGTERGNIPIQRACAGDVLKGRETFSFPKGKEKPFEKDS